MSSLRFLLLMGATALTLTACDQIAALVGGKKEGQDPAAAGAGAPPAMPVTVAKPLTQSVDEYREFSGRFEATDTVEVRSRVSGYLTQVLFKDGAIVQKGTPLFVIDPRPFEATLRQREADRALAASQVTAADNDYNRAETLYKSGDVSAALLDQRRAARDSAKASVASAQAAVDSARLDLAYTRISAPITGRISRNLVSLGNLINPGESVLTTIVSMDPIYFYFDVDEQTYLDYARTHPDQGKDKLSIPIGVSLMDEKDYRHLGTVDFIDNALSTSSGTMRARATLENPKMYFTPGMFGRARIRIGGADKGILIPDEAIITDQSRKLVYIVNDKNVVESRTVEPAQLDKGLRVIGKGLKGDEWIVINGLQRAHEGGSVAPTQSEIKTNEAEGTLTTPNENDPTNPAEDPVDISKQAPAEDAAGAATGTGAPAAAPATQSGNDDTQAAPAAETAPQGNAQ